MELNSVADVLQHLGIDNLGQIHAPNNYSYIYMIEWDTAVGTLTSDDATVTVDSETIFVVSNMFLLPAHVADEEGSTLGAGPGWIENTNASGTLNTGLSLSHFRMELEAGGQRWQSDPVPAAALCSIPGGQIFPLHQFVAAPGAQIRCTLYNDSDNIAPTARLALMGKRINKNL